jgi:2-keto-4-pentenoate hydratase/2-oxohepta-3-ene-1,7-dioic acid hydratase in catechol pathway
MRLVRYNGGRTGVLAGGKVLDAGDVVPELIPGASWVPLISRWEQLAPVLAELARSAEADASKGIPLAEVQLEAPVTDPAARIFAMGGNFPMHTAQTAGKLEMKLADSVTSGAKHDTPPWGFYVIPGTIVGSGHDVTPPAATQKLDYEAEVGVVLARDRAPGGAVQVWGYTGWNDFSIRDAAFGLSKVDHGPLTWSLQKNFFSANACGPWMVVGPIPAEGLRILCHVNGELRQDGNTVDMKYDIGDIVGHIEEYMPLGAGDMILTGTPGGTGMEGGPDGPFLDDGDVCEVEITAASGEPGAGDPLSTGVLRNRVVLAASVAPMSRVRQRRLPEETLR